MPYMAFKAVPSKVNPAKARLDTPLGGLIEIRDDAQPLGRLELEKWVIVDVPDATKAQLIDLFKRSWHLEVDYEIINQNLGLDGFRVRVFATVTSASDLGVGGGQITRAKVQNFLDGWDCNFVSASLTDGVRFDIGVYQSAISQSFWMAPVNQVVFTEVDYNQQTGIHRISADYSALVNAKPLTVQQIVAMRGGLVVSHVGSVITFDIARNTVLSAFREDVTSSVKELLYKSRYYLTETQINAIIAAGRRVTRTLAQVTSEINDITNG